MGRCGAILLATLVLSCVIVKPVFSQGNVPPDLSDAVGFQKKNKGLMAKNLLQRSVRLKKAGNADAAKQMKELADKVKTGKAFTLPPYGTLPSGIGRVDLDTIVERTNDGVAIMVDTVEIESVGGPIPGMRQEVHVPKKVFVATRNQVSPGQSIYVRMISGEFVEIPPEEMQAAELSLVGKTP
jgi:hypothetical protein